MSVQPSRASDEPIRLFRSDLLEFFSHISPKLVLAIWGPVFVYFVGASILIDGRQHGYLYIPLGIFLGWLAWTFVEYVLHRFIFHYHPKTERLKQMFFVMHGVHHAQPMCRTRLVMPPAISLPMSFVFYGALHLVVVVVLQAGHWFNPLFAGMVAGYLVYDLLHYQMHHATADQGLISAIRKHHLRHHGACDFMRFGVSTRLWDVVFGTLPKAGCPDPRPGQFVPGRPVGSPALRTSPEDPARPSRQADSRSSDPAGA